jgi:putative aminopeptidase FrvX
MLGADDGAGCAMLMHLIHSGVPAYYIFTVGEEKGGIGATWLAKHKPDLLKQFDRAKAD